MRIVDNVNATGADIRVSVHVDENTEASIYPCMNHGESVLNIGTVTIFASDADLTTLAAAIGDYVLKRNLGKIK